MDQTMEVDQPQRMRIGNSALLALEIFDSAVENAAKSSVYTLFGLLNKTRTVGGKTLLESWLRQPLCDLKQITQRHDVVEAFNEATECRDSLHTNLLRKVHDVVPLSHKLVQGKAKLEDCYKLYRSICALQAMITQLADVEECTAVQELILTPLNYSARELEKMRSLIESTVIFNETSQRYCIKPEIDENLLELSDEMERLKSKAEAVAVSLRSETGTENIKLEADSETGFYFKVTLKSEKNVRSAKITVLNCTKGAGMSFTTSKLQAINEEFCGLNEQYDEGQKQVEDDVIQTCVSFGTACESLGEKIAFLDVLVSFSVFICSTANPYVRPELYEKGSNIFDIRDCRHPIVESIPFAPSFIPNDISFDNECRFVTLTGPNAGGKSTYLKSMAIAVLLCQIGCFVPASSARMSLVDGIFCRVGAGDIQNKGISTFMAEMIDVSVILNEATRDSLVIIDELGRGTSTFDGFGIVYAVSEEIVQLKNAYPTLVKNLKIDTYLDSEGVMTILYKISEGVSDKSFGINIARQVGFPEEIVQNAEQILKIYAAT